MALAVGAAVSDPRRLPVLVVDDAPMTVAIVRAVLGQLGFRDIDAASDGSAGLVRLQRRRYGLIIADWNVSPMPGYELLRRIRADQSLRETPFVMMSHEEQADCFPAARRAGVSACLVKPLSTAGLRDTIKSIFAGAAATRR